MVVIAYRCDRCNRYLAETEVRKLRAGSGYLETCPTCGDVVRKETSRTARPLPGLLATAFLYPFRGATALWVVSVLVVMCVFKFVRFGWLLGPSAELAFLFAVLKSTANGQDELVVEPADLSDRTEWLLPLLKYLAAVGVSFFPAMLAVISIGGGAGGGAIRSDALPTVYILAGLGLLYFPSALVVAANVDGFASAFNVVAGFSFIARIPGPYAITLGFLGCAVAAGAVMSAAASAIDGFVLGAIARSIAELFAPIVAMRMLGLLMLEHAEEL